MIGRDHVMSSCDISDDKISLPAGAANFQTIGTLANYLSNISHGARFQSTFKSTNSKFTLNEDFHDHEPCKKIRKMVTPNKFINSVTGNF